MVLVISQKFIIAYPRHRRICFHRSTVADQPIRHLCPLKAPPMYAPLQAGPISYANTTASRIMAPKAVKGGRTLGSSNDSFARGAYQTIMSKDNRSVVTAIGMFAVRFQA